MKRDVTRDERICFAYTAKVRGKYMARVDQIAGIHKISIIRVYQILERNNVKKRREVKA